MCSASRDWHCWNSFGFDGPLAVQRIVSAITAELYQLDGFEDQFADMVRSARRDRSGSTADDWRKLLSDEAALAKEKENFNSRHQDVRCPFDALGADQRHRDPGKGPGPAAAPLGAPPHQEPGVAGVHRRVAAAVGGQLPAAGHRLPGVRRPDAAVGPGVLRLPGAPGRRRAPAAAGQGQADPGRHRPRRGSWCRGWESC